MDIAVPRLSFADVALAPAEEATRGRPAAELDLDRMISIGGPTIVPISLDDLDEDDDIRPFVAKRAAEFSFHLLHVATTVVPEPDLLLTRVALEFTLSRLDPQAKPVPVALSMVPEQLDQPVELSKSLSLKAPLKLVDVGIEVGSKTTTGEVYLQAMNELRADPKWELYRTKNVAIKGMQRFAMIVQTPRDDGCGSLTVRATVKHKSWGSYRDAADYLSPTPTQFTFD
jgi:hypothetical protein